MNSYLEDDSWPSGRNTFDSEMTEMCCNLIHKSAPYLMKHLLYTLLMSTYG